VNLIITSCAGGRPPQYAPAPLQVDIVDLVDLLTLKVVSESSVMGAISVPILVFLGLSILDLSPICTTDRSDVRRASSLNAPYLRGGGITSEFLGVVEWS